MASKGSMYGLGILAIAFILLTYQQLGIILNVNCQLINDD